MAAKTGLGADTGVAKEVGALVGAGPRKGIEVRVGYGG